MRLSTGSTFEETPWMSSAQMPPSFPGWSEWVVFGVMAPVTTPNNSVQHAPKLPQP